MSALQNAIAFFVNLGVYDVVLPFLLVFTIIFALLEKSKVLGVEEAGKQKGQPKKNLNAMVAFVTGFLVIASTELVRVINTVMADAVLLALLAVLFLMLVGSFQFDITGSEGAPWRKFLTGFMLVGIVLIFLNALGWLELTWRYLVSHIDGPIVGSFLLLIIVLAGMVWITKDGSAGKSGGD